MTGICGWLGGNAENSAIGPMAQTLARFDHATARTATLADAAVAAAGLGRSADVAVRGDVLSAIWGYPVFLDPALAQVAAREGAAAAAAEGYARLGEALLDGIRGTFALAILDPGRAEALLAIDRAGIANIIWAEADGAIVFGSATDAVARHPRVPAEISPQAIYDYVYFHMVPGPATIYRGLTRLLPGEVLRWKGGRAASRRYWEMHFVEDERRSFRELKEGFLGSLRQSVADASGGSPTGCFLSGGTDSSTVAGLLGQVTGQPARTYSIGFDAAGYDEMGYARIAARHFGTQHHEYYVTPDDVASAIPRIAAIYDQPFGNSSAIPTFYCARLARNDGIETLLGGDGGDELFGGNERYAKQYLYSVYSDLPSWLRRGVIEPLLFLPPEVGPIGKLQRYARNASTPMPERYENYNLLERLGPATVFTPEFLSAADTTAPKALMTSVYNRAHAGTLINRMLALDLKFTLADNDLPKVSRSCELAGVEVRFPMLTERVVDFSASLHPSLKLRRTKLRYFFKEALRGFLPDEIITKQKHGFGLPFGAWLQSYEPLRDLARDSLHDLGHRGIVQKAFLDQLIGNRVAEHASYYGAMVWVLMMLEQWFKHHKDPTA